MGRRLNLEEIGRLAGVSRSTVSRVVNGAPNVSDQAKARVEAVVEQTGYRPHAAARSLAANRTNVGGLLHGSSTVPAAAAVVEQASERSTEHLAETCDEDHDPRSRQSSMGTVVCPACGAPRSVGA